MKNIDDDAGNNTSASSPASFLVKNINCLLVCGGFSPNKTKQRAKSKQIVPRAATEIWFSDISAYSKCRSAQDDWNFEPNVSSEADLLFLVFVQFQARESLED